LGKNRNAAERVDELDIALFNTTIEKLNKLLVSDVHNRIGTIYSDRRTGVERHLARYNDTAGWAKEYYPVAKEAGTATGTVLNVQILTAATPIADVLLGAGYLAEVQYVRAAGNGAFAANRELNVSVYDGTNHLFIYQSGVAALVGTEDGLIHPTDEFTAVATYPATRNSFDIHSGSYLHLVAVGLAAAETITVYTHMINRDAGGLRA
jgi:hypothetical protein